MTATVRCELCPRQCVLGPGQRGDCRSRINYRGRLVTLVYGKAISANPYDPVEKKPLFHFLPGTRCFSIATAGCNLHCKNCQNAEISQLNPDDADPSRVADLPPEKVVALARRFQCASIAYTYSEPITFFEYTRDSQTIARRQGVKNILVTAGYIQEKPLRELCKTADAANLDIKAYSDEFYRTVCGGTLEPVLRTAEIMFQQGVWLEITNLLVTTLNDKPDLIRQLCRWHLQHLGPEVPLHFSRFFPRYKLAHLPPTPVETLVQAREIALQEGIKFVYVGNINVPEGGDTFCPDCRKPVLRRQGYTILENNLNGGKCGFCGRRIPGVWT